MGYKLVLVAHCFANTIYSKRSLTKISQFSAISVAYFANFLQTIRMGRIAKSSTVQVIEGVYLKPSARSPYWQTYFHVDGKTFRKSTKRKELEQAKHVALEQYYDFRRNLADGVLPGSVGFQKLMDVYLQYIEHEGKHAYHSATAKRHFLPFFKNVKVYRA